MNNYCRYLQTTARTLANRLRSTLVILSIAIPVAAHAALVELDRPTDGVLRESCAALSLTNKETRLAIACRIVVRLSDSDGTVIPVEGWPRDEILRGNVMMGAGVDFVIPKTVKNKDTGAKTQVRDVLQLTFFQLPYEPPLRDVFPSSSLSIEAIAFDVETSTYSVNNIFGAVANRVGFNVGVTIPDLFSDINGDGILDDQDVLFAIVDLYTYLNAIPSIELGSTYSIDNGLVTDLPGMRFSSTAFGFDPSTGFDNGTPFTGQGVTGATHVLFAVPLPSSGSLVALGLALLIGGRSGGKLRSPFESFSSCQLS